MVKKFSINDTRKAAIVKQEESTGLRDDSAHIKKMTEIFNKKYWSHFNQPL